MKNAPFVLLLLLLCSASLAAKTVSPDTLTSNVTRSAHDRWFAPDKGHHFMASAFLTGFSSYAFRQEAGASERVSNRAAIGFAVSIGVVEEIYDGVRGKGTPGIKDIVADIAGIAVGILILNVSSE